MAGIRHKDVGTTLTYTEFHVADSHTVESLVSQGDIEIAAGYYFKATGYNTSLRMQSSQILVAVHDGTQAIFKSGGLGVGMTGTPGERMHLYVASGDVAAKIETDSAGQADLKLDGVRTTDAAVGAVRFFNAGVEIATISGRRAAADDAGQLRFDIKASGGSLVEAMRIAPTGYVSLGAVVPATILELAESQALGESITDGYSAAITIDPEYTASMPFVVTRHNYIKLDNIELVQASVTDAAVFCFNAAPGTHLAVDTGTTKTTPGTVNAWVKININGTIYYIPAYTSKTS